MPQNIEWMLLNILIWCVGVKALHDLRLQFDRRAKTWFLLDWGVRFCMLMEVAMLGMGHARGLALLSVVMGIAAAPLMWLGFSSLQRELCYGKPSLLAHREWDHLCAFGAASTAVLCLAAGRAAPETVDFLTRALRPVEGSVWLVASAWLGLRLSVTDCPSREARLFRTSEFSLSFAFAFLHAALTLSSRLTAIAIPPEAGILLGTLFVLTLVWNLAGLVTRLHSFRAAEAHAELKSLNERLFGIEKLVTVGTLAAGAAHDFNNVLTAILGTVELAQREEGLSPRTREDLKDIRASAGAASAIAARLMGIARSGAGERFSGPGEAVERPLALLSKEFARHGITVLRRIEDAPPVAFDLGQLSNVCLNLYLNARDAMIPKGGGVLDVRLRSSPNEIELTVSDTGTGIPAEFQPRMFEPLQSTKGAKGTGLGLSGSRLLLAAMGGRITFETQEGRGTTFRVSLPTSVRRDTASGGSILIVDDDEAVRRTLKRMIETLEREAVMAENGEEAVRLLSADSRIGLVISDLQMPVMNGLELLSRIRSDFKSVRVLLMTGSEADRRELPDSPQVLGLLHKPVMLEDIRRNLA